MALTTTNMGLKVWNLLTDLFSHSDLAGNWASVDTHNHTTGNGVQIPTGGIANNAITTAKLASSAVTDSTIAANTITWDKFASDVVTSLPGSPYDGQLVHYIADGTNGAVWTLRYRSASSSAYKWEFVGGTPMFTLNTSPITHTSPSFTSPSGSLQLTVPFAGDYRLHFGADATLSAGVQTLMRISSAPSWPVRLVANTAGAASDFPELALSTTFVLTGCVASQVLLMQLETIGTGGGGSGGSSIWDDTFLYVTPVRCG